MPVPARVRHSRCRAIVVVSQSGNHEQVTAWPALRPPRHSLTGYRPCKSAYMARSRRGRHASPLPRPLQVHCPLGNPRALPRIVHQCYSRCMYRADEARVGYVGEDDVPHRQSDPPHPGPRPTSPTTRGPGAYQGRGTPCRPPRPPDTYTLPAHHDFPEHRRHDNRQSSPSRTTPTSKAFSSTSSKQPDRHAGLVSAVAPDDPLRLGLHNATTPRNQRASIDIEREFPWPDWARK